MKREAFILALAVLAAASFADDLDRKVQSIMAEAKVPGLSLAVLKEGKIVRLSAYGYGSLEWRSKTTPDTKFEIASMTKMFTGAAARILIEEKKLSLEDPLEKFFGPLSANWKGAKVRHLVTMSNGVPDDWGTELIPYNADVVTDFDDASMLKAFQEIKMAAPVGAEFHYSSPAYSLLGMIVAKVSGQPLPEFVRKRIFERAGMTESSFIDNSKILPQRADGYRLAKGELVRGWHLGQYLHARPDVGMLSTARDMARWLIALDQKQIVAQPEKLWEGATSDTGRALDYSFGWFPGLFLGHRRAGHDGRFRTGFRSRIDRFLDEGVDVIVLANMDDAPVERIAALAVKKYVPGLPDPMAESLKTDGYPQETALVIEVLKSLGRGKIPEERMAPNALGPMTLEDVSGMLGVAKNFRYAGRRTLSAGGVSFHGHKLVDYTTICFDLGPESHCATLYRDATGKIVHLEPTM